MPKTLKRALSLILPGVLALTLAACVSFEQDSIDCAATSKAASVAPVTQVSLVLAPTDNFTNFEALLDALKPQILALLADKPGEINIIVADGVPKNVLKMASSDSGEDAIIANRHLVDRVSNGLYCVVPTEKHPVTSPYQTVKESDVIKALSLSAVPFENAQAAAKHIFVIGNGLHTAGQGSFLAAGIPSEGQVGKTIAQLRDQHVLPDLHNATVTWSGLGQVTGAQPSFNEQSLRGLRSYWTSLIEASNGAVGKIQGEGQAGPPSANSIHVSVIAGQPDACVTASLSEQDGFNFSPGTATFLNPDKARAGAVKIAGELAAKKQCQGQITVTGYVSSSKSKAEYVFGNADDAALSLARAVAFKGLLQEAGVQLEIVAVGGGKGPETDWDADGTYVDAKGQLNRKVTVSQQ